MGVFKKMSGKLKKKILDFVSSNLQKSLYIKAFDW